MNGVTELVFGIICFLSGVGAREIVYYIVKTRQEARNNRGFPTSEHL